MGDKVDNTIQISTIGSDVILNLIHDAVYELRERFRFIRGRFVVTIEFYPDEETNV